MTEPAAVLDLTPLGVRVEIPPTPARTDDELFEFVVAGRPAASWPSLTCTPSASASRSRRARCDCRWRARRKHRDNKRCVHQLQIGLDRGRSPWAHACTARLPRTSRELARQLAALMTAPARDPAYAIGGPLERELPRSTRRANRRSSNPGQVARHHAELPKQSQRVLEVDPLGDPPAADAEKVDALDLDASTGLPRHRLPGRWVIGDGAWRARTTSRR